MPPLSLPPLGLGTAGVPDAELVEEALDAGYRFLDTAQVYDTEAIVGEGLAASAVDRSEVVVATKVATTNLGYEDALRTAAESRDRLGTTIDVLYVHWPRDAYDPEGTWRAFDELVERGVTEHVAVSNFTPATLDVARERSSVPIVANQIEYHPLLDQSEMLEYVRAHDMYLVAYAPLADGEALDEPEIEAVAEEYGATPAQVCLAWLHAQDRVVPIPGAEAPWQARENYAALGVDLAPEDLARIDAIEREHRVYPDPREYPGVE
ncbi:MAG: aldo/keto reductase [Halobacteriaceae archaeon]